MPRKDSQAHRADLPIGEPLAQLPVTEHTRTDAGVGPFVVVSEAATLTHHVQGGTPTCFGRNGFSPALCGGCVCAPFCPDDNQLPPPPAPIGAQ